MDEPSTEPDWPTITEHLRLIRRYLGWVVVLIIVPWVVVGMVWAWSQ